MSYTPFQINIQVAQQQAAASQSYGTGKVYRRFKVGSPGIHVVRILPPWSDAGLLGINSWKIWNVPDPEKPGETTNHICIEMAFPERGVRCPILEVMHRYHGAGLDSFFEKLKPQPTAYMNALVRSTMNTNQEKYPVDPILPVIFETQQTTLSWVYSKCMDPEIGNITDPYNGRDVKITRVLKNQKTSYERELKLTTSPLFDDSNMLNNALNNMYDLTEIYKFPDDRIYGRIVKSAQLLEDKIKYLISASNAVIIPSAGLSNQHQQQFPQAVIQNDFSSFPVQQQPIQQPIQQPVQQQPIQQPIQQPVQQQPIQQPVQQQPVQQQVFPQQQPVQQQPVQQQVFPQQQPTQQPIQQQQVFPQQTTQVGSNLSPLEQELLQLGIRKPGSAPPCFSDYNVYDSSRKECLACIFDMECVNAIQKRKGL